MLVAQILEFIDMFLEGRVIDQNIELAELSQRLFDRVLAKLRIGDIARSAMQSRPSFSTARFVSSASSCSSR